MEKYFNTVLSLFNRFILYSFPLFNIEFKYIQFVYLSSVLFPFFCYFFVFLSDVKRMRLFTDLLI
jgi:hypothetical protein